MTRGVLTLVAALAFLTGVQGLSCEEAIEALVEKNFEVGDHDNNGVIVIEDANVIYQLVDVNSNSILEDDEILRLLTILVPNFVAIQDLLKRELDTSGDDEVSTSEFESFVLSLDEDGDGQIVESEYMHVWTELATPLFKEAGETPDNCTW